MNIHAIEVSDSADINDGAMLSRRALVGTLATLPAFGLANSSKAQEKYKGLADEVFRQAQRASDLTNKIGWQSLMSNVDIATEIVRQDLNSRGRTLLLAEKSGFFEESGNANAWIAALPKLAPSNFPLQFDGKTVEGLQKVVAGIRVERLELAPSPRLVAPMAVASLVSPALPSKKPEEVRDSDIRVVMDIILQTLGISVGEANLLTSLVESDAKLKTDVIEVIKAISSRDWSEVIRTSEKVFQLIVATLFAKNVAPVLATSKRKLMFALTLRCVPIAGWIYLCLPFVVSVKHNYSRFSFAK